MERNGVTTNALWIVLASAAGWVGIWAILIAFRMALS
jgi:hypothetical protein